MARRVFYSFHYNNDVWRTAQVRNIGTVDGSKPVTSNAWEAVRRSGDAAIRAWIKQQLANRSCTIVLVGSETASRRWVRYEIQRSWSLGRGIVGIRVHKLRDSRGRRARRGRNPFEQIIVNKTGRRLSNYVRLYDPTADTSQGVYRYIARNLEAWVERAVAEVRRRP